MWSIRTVIVLLYLVVCCAALPISVVVKPQYNRVTELQLFYINVELRWPSQDSSSSTASCGNAQEPCSDVSVGSSASPVTVCIVATPRYNCGADCPRFEGQGCRSVLHVTSSTESTTVEKFEGFWFQRSNKKKGVFVAAEVRHEGKVITSEHFEIRAFARHAMVSDVAFGSYTGTVQPLASVAVHLQTHKSTLSVELTSTNDCKCELFVYNREPQDAPGVLDVPIFATEGLLNTKQYVNSSVFDSTSVQQSTDFYFAIFNPEERKTLNFAIVFKHDSDPGEKVEREETWGSILVQILIAILEGLG